MKLRHIIISGFKSVKEAEKLLIDGKVTILIGANDHGKSNLLEAILRLNDDKPIIAEDKNWDMPEDKQPRIEWYFSVTNEELAKTNELDTHKEAPAELAVTPVTAEAETQPATTPGETPEYFPVNKDGLIGYYKEGINTPLRVLTVPCEIPASKETEILKLKPRVESFLKPITTNLKDEVTLAELSTPEFEFMQGIFHLAGIWENKDSIFVQNDTTDRLLDEASKKLTKVLNDKWNQGRDLAWRLVYSGTNGDHILIQIHDPSIQSRFTRPSHKSSGFQTFFVLSMMINARKYNNPSDSFIFLFDEPGIYLHPYAQLDLQRSFEAASDTAQIVYTTHSLFLISKNHPNRNRVVSKTLSGTKIDQKPFQKNWKSVRESLGILLCNNFLIAEKSLLVEGPSDVIYLYDVVKRLKEKNKVDIDLNDFSVVDAGSPDSYIAMAKLMLSEGRNVVALCDGDPSGKKNVNKLRKCCQKELREKTMKIIPLPENKSIEDICADINLLRDSIKKLSEELTSSGERKYVPGLNIDTEILKIKADPLKSLGLTINKTTRLWYKPEDELSKLSIAMIYEELAEKGSPPISRSAQELVKNLKELMELKGEKSADKGVFEEIKS